MLGPYIYVPNVDGAAAVENLRVELTRAKEQARRSDAAAVKAAEELKAEQAAHCQSKKVIAEMTIKLKDATDRCKFLEQEVRLRRILKRSLPKQAYSLCNESYEGGAASGQRYHVWKALYAADEVRGS